MIVKRWLEIYSVAKDRDQASLDLFEFELEREVEARLSLSRELFSGRPDLLRQELNCLIEQLSGLEAFSAEREEWERCARIRDQRIKLELEL